VDLDTCCLAEVSQQSELVLHRLQDLQLLQLLWKESVAVPGVRNSFDFLVQKTWGQAVDVRWLRGADADGDLRLLEELCAIKGHVVVS